MKHIIFTDGILKQYIENKNAVIIPKKNTKHNEEMTRHHHSGHNL